MRMRFYFRNDESVQESDVWTFFFQLKINN